MFQNLTVGNVKLSEVYDEANEKDFFFNYKNCLNVKVDNVDASRLYKR